MVVLTVSDQVRRFGSDPILLSPNRGKITYIVFMDDKRSFLENWFWCEIGRRCASLQKDTIVNAAVAISAPAICVIVHVESAMSNCLLLRKLMNKCSV